jgi:Fms-interacting protein/Thoc5
LSYYNLSRRQGMSPIKKRARIRAGGEEKEQKVTDQSPTPQIVSDPASTIKTLVANVLEDVEKLQDDSTCLRRLKNHMIQLKAIQRQLYTKLAAQRVQLDNAGILKKDQERDEAARLYERTHLESEIRKLKDCRMSSLEKLANDEFGNNISNSSVTTIGSATRDCVTNEEAVSLFLNHADVRNPEQKNRIVATLHQQLVKRGTLESQLSQKQQESALLTRQLQVKHDFLNSLPGHLQAIERASQPLAKFMAKAAAGNSNSRTGQIQKMTGKERLIRIETAQLLSPPLYTLFTLLQHYADRIDPCDNDEKCDSKNPKLTIKVMSPALDVRKDSILQQQQQQQVSLQLPVPDDVLASLTNISSSNSSSKRVTIHFRYFPQLSLVTALATGCGSTLNQDTLLDELFPGDSTAAANQNVSSKLKMLEITETNLIAPNSIVGSPTGTAYQWCNVLAGLYQVPTKYGDIDKLDETDTILVHSTRTVINELLRRIRANAILKHCIQSLKRNHIPMPPTSIGNDNCTQSSEISWKLIQFVPVSDCADSGKNASFVATFQKRSDKFMAHVRIHMSRYPAVPPIWKIVLNDNETNEPPLYNSCIAQLEQRVNTDLLSQRHSDSVVADGGETFCEWILIHQIREIMMRYDTCVEAMDTNTEYSGVRKMRGRDRIKMIE